MSPRANDLLTSPVPVNARSPKRRDSKMSQIMCTARGLFLTRGFDAMTMDLIARAAGVSKATLYAKFKSKEDLFAVVVEEESQRISNGVWDGLDTGGDIEEVLKRIGRNFCAVFITDRTFMMQRAVVGAIARFPDVGQVVYQSGPMKMIENMSKFLDTANNDGRLNVDRPRQAAQNFFDLVRGDADLRGMLALELPTEQDMERRIELAVNIFLGHYHI